MNLSLGIVGLPNVGKSTLFNALTKQNVLAANYPFATIDPNVGVVAVSDTRIKKISEISKPEKITPAIVEFVDIAGLVKGAASGAGLGNKFLSHIKEVSAIVQVVRAFSDGNITHVENSVDPKRDIELVQTELGLKDIDTVTSRVNGIRSRARFDKDLLAELAHLELLLKHLEEGKLAFDFEKPKDEEVIMARKSLFLLTDKPVIYLVNSDDQKSAELIKDIVGNKTVIVMDVKTESELAGFDDADRLEFMKEFGLDETGLDRLTRAAYETLGLISYFTEGPEEVRAWTVLKDSKAPEAAAAIHTDFQKKFIACDVCYYQDFLDAGSWNKAKEVGKVRLEGKEYIVKDGDIMIFRHG
ncbi:MAG: redox-regulated ATPase YchF [Candidatus Dojkabacteria bacterium]